MIRIIIIRNLIILKGEIMTFHYMVMANHAIYNRMLMEILEETGLTAGQPKVLDYLGYHDGASQKEIAAHCYIEAATLTSVLNGMEAKALIERRRLNGNRRTFHIFLTQKGGSSSSGSWKHSRTLRNRPLMECRRRKWNSLWNYMGKSTGV